MAQRYIYLSDELNNKLKEEENASALIQQLLTDYYEMEKTRQMTPEEIDKKIKILEIKLEAKKKISELEDANKN